MLLSGNFRSEHVASVESFQTSFLWQPQLFKICRPLLVSGYVQSEHVAAVEMFQTTILSEH